MKSMLTWVDASFQTPVEGADEYDLIEWAAKLDWCSGNIGLCGVSYLVQSQWMVAQMRPPSLKAIIAWEGWSDGTRLPHFPHFYLRHFWGFLT
jgi:putative CocE/NonD family hydrolase